MPTPVEHYEHAERLLDVAAEHRRDRLDEAAEVAERRALVHATLSNAPWALDDRVLDEVAAGLDAETVGALVAVVRELATWVDTAPVVDPDNVHAEAYVDATWRAKADVARLVRPVLELVEQAAQA